jgi:flagellar hook-basal body complex protein FliE
MKIENASQALITLPPKQQPGNSRREEFGPLLNNMIKDLNGMQGDADRQVGQTLLGEKDLHEAMLSLEKANLGFKLLIQVRNKALQAYDDLSKMPI